MRSVTDRAAARVAAALWLVTLVVVAWGLVLPVVADLPRGTEELGNAPSVVLIAVINASLGAIIARRRPAHPIGWLLLVGSGLLGALHLVALSYAALGPDRVGGATLAAWIAQALQTTTVTSIVIVFHLFPTGRALGSRWRIFVWASVAGLACNLVVDGLTPGPMPMLPSYGNPFGVTGADPLLAGIRVLAGVLVGLGVVGGVVSLGVRLHRSDGVERQQVKLLFYAAAVGVCALVGANLVFPEAMEHAVVGNLVWGAAAAGLSLAITIALLRHRLFEIDRLISRTATYGTVTAVLALCYVTVAMLPAALYGLESDLLVAAATLVSAAVVVPVRRRVRAQMDRRFDRERYDAARVAATFGTSLRDAVDPDRVVDELVRVVEAALRPDGTQVWLRTASPRRPG